MAVSGEDVATGMTAMGFIIFLARKTILGWFSDKTDVTRESAEANLYANLILENKRMSDTQSFMSEQITTLMKNNIQLLAKVGELERKIEAQHDWESVAKDLMKEVETLNAVITNLKK